MILALLHPWNYWSFEYLIRVSSSNQVSSGLQVTSGDLVSLLSRCLRSRCRFSVDNASIAVLSSCGEIADGQRGSFLSQLRTLTDLLFFNWSWSKSPQCSVVFWEKFICTKNFSHLNHKSKGQLSCWRICCSIGLWSSLSSEKSSSWTSEQAESRRRIFDDLVQSLSTIRDVLINAADLISQEKTSRLASCQSILSAVYMKLPNKENPWPCVLRWLVDTDFLKSLTVLIHLCILNHRQDLFNLIEDILREFFHSSDALVFLANQIATPNGLLKALYYAVSHSRDHRMSMALIFVRKRNSKTWQTIPSVLSWSVRFKRWRRSTNWNHSDSMMNLNWIIAIFCKCCIAFYRRFCSITTSENCPTNDKSSFEFSPWNRTFIIYWNWSKFPVCLLQAMSKRWKRVFEHVMSLGLSTRSSQHRIPFSCWNNTALVCSLCARNVRFARVEIDR